MVLRLSPLMRRSQIVSAISVLYPAERPRLGGSLVCMVPINGHVPPGLSLALPSELIAAC